MFVSSTRSTIILCIIVQLVLSPIYKVQAASLNHAVNDHWLETLLTRMPAQEVSPDSPHTLPGKAAWSPSLDLQYHHTPNAEDDILTDNHDSIFEQKEESGHENKYLTGSKNHEDMEENSLIDDNTVKLKEGHIISLPADMSKRRWSSFRDDLGKRRWTAFRDDLGKRGWRSFREDLGKKARSSFRDDLGKRRWSSFRDDLGKRYGVLRSSFRDDLGKRGLALIDRDGLKTTSQ